MAVKKQENTKEANFALGKQNLNLILIGFVIIIIGFLLMLGGGSDDPKVFSKAIFSTQRIIVAPIVVVFGFFFEIWAIMKKPKE